MTPLTKTVRRVTLETYGYGKQARKLVVSLERGDLISIRCYELFWHRKNCRTGIVRFLDV
jgi:hypothetical protein